MNIKYVCTNLIFRITLYLINDQKHLLNMELFAFIKGWMCKQRGILLLKSPGKSLASHLALALLFCPSCPPSFSHVSWQIFVTEVNSHRDQIIELDKTGTHLKYFSQKQDVVLIKNLLLSVQSRWDKVVQRSVERGRLLDDARKRAKQVWNEKTKDQKYFTIIFFFLYKVNQNIYILSFGIKRYDIILYVI